MSATLVATNLAGSPGASVTSNLSSGHESPWPIALMKATFRVQQLKNASACKLTVNERNADTSFAEKNLSATSPVAKSGRICSTSTPNSRPRPNASKTVPPE